MPATEKFTPSQKANAVLWYGICGDTNVVQNKFKAVYGYAGEKPEVPSANEIIGWYKNFRHMGFVDVQDAVIHEEATGEHGPIDEHHYSKIENVVSNVLNKLNTWFLDGPKIRTFHPNHMELITLDLEDIEERRKFAQDQLDHIHKWSPILKSMWFTGETKFYIDGRVEGNNLVYTANRKTDDSVNWPHNVVRQYQPSQEPHITVWAAMNAGLIIGPYFFDGEISPESYKEILEKFVHELLRVTTSIEHPIFIHDDSKVHANADVTSYIEQQFPHHWIGTGSTYAAWPHHSSDLSPINFFLWGYIKSRVYKTRFNFGDLEELKQRILLAFKKITLDLLEESVEEYKTRLERVHKTRGDLVDATIYGREVDFDHLNAWSMYAWPYV
uniref:Transposase n=1 Tax=Acrobeloides nanus TaxID=290746 RepID=A0A914E450_9BILA